MKKKFMDLKKSFPELYKRKKKRFGIRPKKLKLKRYGNRLRKIGKVKL